MGCFNATGFFSKLPLQAGDKMVLIFCADMSKISDDALPIYVAEKYVPLNAPIFCEYNDYGALFEKSVVRDANAEFFEKSIGTTCEKLCDMIHDFGNVSIEELSEAIEYNEEEGEYSESRKKAAKEYLRILHILFDNGYVKWVDKMGLTWIMEHKDVYDKMSALGKGSITSWFDDDNVVEKRCNAAFNMIEDYPEANNVFNLLNTGTAYNKIKFDLLLNKVGKELSLKDFEDKRKEMAEKYGNEYQTFFSSACLHEGLLSEAFPTYRSIIGVEEWKKYKDNFVDFFRFTRAMNGLHRIFEPSTYASQEVATDITMATYNILKEKSDEICKKYGE